jgi:hypothetical protein
MTAQASDTFIYKGMGYWLIGINGEGLAKPQDFGMKPVMKHTGCYRGFYSGYEITDDGIYLKEMTLNEEKGNYKLVNGVKPIIDDLWGATYKDISIRVSFTGKIRLAKDFIQELYVHHGFQKPSAFETVIDLKFEDSRIVETNDRSKEVAAIRGRFKERYEAAGLIRMGKRIKDAFSLDMDLK